MKEFSQFLNNLFSSIFSVSWGFNSPALFKWVIFTPQTDWQCLFNARYLTSLANPPMLPLWNLSCLFILTLHVTPDFKLYVSFHKTIKYRWGYWNQFVCVVLLLYVHVSLSQEKFKHIWYLGYHCTCGMGCKLTI